VVYPVVYQRSCTGCNGADVVGTGRGHGKVQVFPGLDPQALLVRLFSRFFFTHIFQRFPERRLSRYKKKGRRQLLLQIPRLRKTLSCEKVNMSQVTMGHVTANKPIKMTETTIRISGFHEQRKSGTLFCNLECCTSTAAFSETTRSRTLQNSGKIRQSRIQTNPPSWTGYIADESTLDFSRRSDLPCAVTNLASEPRCCVCTNSWPSIYTAVGDWR
jgi:hypothetical protein